MAFLILLSFDGTHVLWLMFPHGFPISNDLLWFPHGSGISRGVGMEPSSHVAHHGGLAQR